MTPGPAPRRRPLRHDPCRARARRLRRIAIAWGLAVVTATAAAAAGDLLDLANPSCCPKSVLQASLPAAPCQALLPLACCDGTTLPAVAPAPPDRSDCWIARITAVPDLAPAGASSFDAQRTLASSPRSSPLALSVMLRI
jgi:hypothetical protein